jgi:organic radical activating enzyme
VKYPIADIFRSIQGEGHFVGYPTTFVRLAGCSVQECSIRDCCDEAPWKSKGSLDTDEILLKVRQCSPAGIVCITGGEPTDHNLTPLIDTLHEAKFRLHIETSGVRELTGAPLEWITVSPKTETYKQRVGHTLKIVVTPGMGWNRIRDLDWETSFFHRYLQPVTDHNGFTNIEEVKALLLSWDNFPGRWALSTQAHKAWKLP